MNWLLGLPSDPSDDAIRATGGALRFAPVLPVVLLVVLGAALLAMALLGYRKTPAEVPAGRRLLMATLRGLFYLLLLGLLLRPVLALTLEKEAPKTVAVLVDASASMEIIDPREAPEDRARAAIARGELPADAGLAAAPPAAAGVAAPRADLAAAALSNAGLALLDQLGARAEIVRYEFGSNLTEPDDNPAAISEGAPETAIGDALTEVLRRHSAGDLGAVLLVSDGASNSGGSPLAAAETLRERGVPVFAYGVGVTGTRDLAVAGIDAPPVALVGDAVPVAVRVTARGMAGTPAQLIVTLAGAPVADTGFVVEGDGEQVVELSILPERAGEFELAVRVEADDSEVTDENNALEGTLRVIDSAIRVLMVESAPRWEFKYIQAMLLREQRIELKCFLAEADPDVARVEDSPYLDAFPPRREDLFGFDLILFGDVDPSALPPDAAGMISSFVADGGGSLAVLSGKRFTPSSYRNTELEKLLPVDLAPARIGGPGDAVRAVRPILTEAGAKAGFLNLEPGRPPAARWGELPPLYSFTRSDGAKPAATTYLAHPDGWPVVAGQRYGAGEVLWLGTDNTWRWRRNTGDLYHTRFWGQVVQKLAGRRLAAGSRRGELRAANPTVDPGGRFSVSARLLDNSFSPRTEAELEAVFAPADGLPGEGRRITLRAVPGQPGYYRAEFPAGSEPGRFRLSLPDESGAAVDLEVAGAGRELATTALDVAALHAVADATGGAFFREEDLVRLPAIAAAALEPTKSELSREADLWASPLYFILLLIPLTIEWILRKLNELK